MTTIRNADQIYVLDQGRVVEQGSHDMLMAREKGVYHEMFTTQQRERIYCDPAVETLIVGQAEMEEKAHTCKQTCSLYSIGDSLTEIVFKQ